MTQNLSVNKIEYLRNVRKEISQGRLEVAINDLLNNDTLYSLKNTKCFQDEILHQKCLFSHFQSKHRNSVSDESYLDLQFSKINHSIIQIISKIEFHLQNSELELKEEGNESNITKFIITIDDDIEAFKKEKINNFVKALSIILEIEEKDISIESIYEGSVKIVVAIPSDKSKKLISLFKQGVLTNHNIIDCQEKENTANKIIIFIYETNEGLRISLKEKINNSYRDEIFIKDFNNIQSLQNSLHDYLPDIFIASIDNNYQSFSEIMSILNHIKTHVIFLADASLESSMIIKVKNEFSLGEMLVKPFEINSLLDLIDYSLSQKLTSTYILRNYIFLKKGGSSYKISIDDIILVESDLGSVKIYVHIDNKVEIFMSRLTITSFINMVNNNDAIDNTNLIRVHREFIVNVNFIKAFTSDSQEITLDFINKTIPCDIVEEKHFALMMTRIKAQGNK